MKTTTLWLVALIVPVRSVDGQSRVPEPVIDSSVCPFECCHFGPWRAADRVVAHVRPAAGAPVAFVIAPGEVVRALRGDLRSARPAGLILRVPLRNPTATFHPGVGDTIQIAGYEGEGEYHWRWHGVTLGNDDFWGAVGDTAAAAQPASFGSFNGTWWVLVTNQRGKSAWIDAGHIIPGGFGDGPGFTGQDSCS